MAESWKGNESIRDEFTPSASFEEIHARQRQLEREAREEEQARVAAWKASRRDGPGVTPGLAYPMQDGMGKLEEELCDFVPTPEMVAHADAGRIDEFVEAMHEVNPKQLAATRDQKPPLHLLEHAAEVEIAKALATGAHKYGRKNFKVTPILANVYGGAIRRHVGAWLAGEDLDPETGLSHLAHIGANINVLFAAMEAGTFVDDRGPEEQSEVQKRMSDASNAGGNWWRP